MPNSVIVPAKSIGFKIKLGISVELTNYNDTAMSYLLLPRSSMNLIPLRSQVSIIDAGYRGELFAIVDNISNFDYKIQQHQKLLQICAADLKPIIVEVVDQLSKGSRGAKGLGSSNKPEITYCNSKFKMMDRSLNNFRENKDLPDVILPVYLRPKL